MRLPIARFAASAIAVAFFMMTAGVAFAQGSGKRPPTMDTDAPQAASAAADPSERDPRDYLKFSSKLTSDCMLHRAQLSLIANTHPTRAIRVVLVNYTGKTRSQGSSDKILPPRSQPQPLGCDGTSGLKRRWEIVSAEFTDSKP